MVETEEVSLVREPCENLTFTPAQAAKTEPKLRDAARALENDKEYRIGEYEEGYHSVLVEDVGINPDGCSICGSDTGKDGLRINIHQKRHSIEVMNVLCIDCATELADELEEYYTDEDNVGDALGELT